MQEAVQRSHERVAARWFGQLLGADRVCYDVLKHSLSSSKVDSFGKFLMKAVSTNSIWCNDRLQSAGYDTDGLCPLCGECDSLRHRFWLWHFSNPPFPQLSQVPFPFSLTSFHLSSFADQLISIKLIP